ncbi:zinc finger protein ZFAT [Aplysia californica]|uniref:Zinc finger protein ZFAT n=1 Tax=Aplysia californica TaxID=6500 RepID=A0ABM1A4V9_APLCA|nr:zinc finger protein ZFAT [Aplysia californica]
MPLDTFICGQCQDSFTDLNEFVLHKQGNCPATAPATPAPPSSSSPALPQGTEVIRLHMNESGEITGMSSLPVGEDESMTNGSTFTFLNDVNMEGDFGNTNLDGNGAGTDNSAQTLIILNNSETDGLGGLDSSGMNLLTPSQSMDGLTSQPEGPLGGQEVKGDTPEVMPTLTEPLAPPEMGEEKVGGFPPKKRRGRSKTGEGKVKVIEAVPPSTPKPTVPETNADGKLVCPQCKRTFAKERHFNTHKCLATSSYVDITKKEIVKIDSGDEEEGHEDLDAGAHVDEEEEFTAPVDEKMSAEKEEEDDEKEMDKEDVEEESADKRKKKRGRKRKRGGEDVEFDMSVQESGAQQMKAAADSLENLPIFKNDEEREAFEACVDVDLSSQVDHMFRIHIIEQELNELSGMVYNTPTMSSLSVYSCNVCEKAFKSLSHIRLHCITHTDVKPFQCSKCSYATNSKGNLYTHMRKHTGQFYRCEQCDFKTVNKSHLIEHKMTHDSRRSQCMICRKDYSTLKSLINHVRKYHTDKPGKEYLQTFLQGRGVRGTTIIHQCHVCNRKFKKRIDRDRHLFIHDIKDLPHVQQCELCDYWASRKIYLDKHYLKHRVIYCCALCDEKFLSTIKLSEHLSSSHSDHGENGTMVADSLLEECINRSLYLPEPLAMTKDGNKYVNLPEELRATSDSNNSVTPASLTSAQTPSPTSVLTPSATTTTPSSGSNTFSQTTTTTTTNDRGPTTDSTLTVVPSAESSGDFLSEFKELTGPSTDLLSPPAPTTGQTVKADMSANDQVNSEVVSSVCQPFSKVEDLLDVSTQGVNSVGTDGGDATVGSQLVENIVESENKDTEDGDGIKSENRVGKDSQVAPHVLMLQNPGSDSEGGEEEVSDKVGSEEAAEGTTSVVKTEGVEGMEEEAEGGEGSDEEEMFVEEQQEAGLASGENSGEKLPETDEVGQESPNAMAKEKSAAEESLEVAEGKAASGSAGTESKNEKIEALIKRMGYRRMSMDIFNKMRDTFGTEECEFCGRLFYSKVDYEPHVRTHTGDKPFACAHCSFRANTKDQLKRHSEKEHEKIAFQCKECDFLAPTRTRLWNHQLKHLGISGLSCPRCSCKFDGMKQLRAHILNQHQDMDKQTLEKLTGYRHRPLGRMGRRSFKCPHCPRTFIRANSDLQKHIWIHEGIKPFACPICPYACRSKNNLQAHMLRHSTEKPFSCSECGKEYKSKTALRWHVRSHKTGKAFKCDKCPYEATQQSHLKRHMETHEVMKRFVCKHCAFSANTLGYMKIHYARHHKGKPFVHEETSETTISQPEKRVFKCLSCGYLFGNLSDLKRHLKIRHLVQMQAIAGMEQLQISEVEVVQYEDTANAATATATLADMSQVQTAPQVVSAGDLQTSGPSDASKPSVSAVSLIQQLLGMSQGDNQVRVVSEDGEPFELSPETIIVQQQDGQLLLTNEAAGAMAGGQYVIQYYNPGEMPPGAESSVAASSSGGEVQLAPAPPDAGQSIQFLTAPQDQGAQFIMTPGVHRQILTSEGQAQILTPEGQTQILTSEGQAQILTSEGQAQILTSEGQPQILTSDGQAQILTSDGQAQILTSEGQAQILTSGGQAQILTSEGQPRILTSNGQAQILASSDGQTQIIYPEDGSGGQLIAIEGSGHLLSAGGEREAAGQFVVNTDLDTISEHLIISDPGGRGEVLEGEGGDDPGGARTSQQLDGFTISTGAEDS